MVRTLMIRQSLMTMVVIVLWCAVASRADDNWPQFRGWGAAGIGSGSPPIQWNVDTGENILWKTPIEGLSHSSPIVWDDRVFLTVAVNAAETEPTLDTGWLGGTGKSAEDTGAWSWQLQAYDLVTGQPVWKREASAGPPLMKRHLKATHANCTPATNGQYIVAFFGAEGLYCFDMDGNLVWKTGFGRLHAGPHYAEQYEWGLASSPVIHDQYVVVQCDCINTSFVAVLRLADGIEVRRIPRSDVTTWSTPLIVQADGQTHIVCNGYREMAAYDFFTGEKRWYLSGGGDIPVPTPQFAHGLVLLTNGHGRSPSYAIAPSARGDLTPRDVVQDEPPAAAGSADDAPDPPGGAPAGLVWYQPQNGSYIPTPIVVGDHLYTCNDNGRLTVTNVQDGSVVYEQRVGGRATYSASAVGTQSHLYLADESGTVRVIKTGPVFEQLSENDMQEIVMATPAIAGNRLLIRTTKQLVCVGNPDKPSAAGE